MRCAAPSRWLALITLTLTALPGLAADDVASKLAEVEAEIAALRKADPAQAPTAAPYADRLEREVRRLRADWDPAGAPAAQADAPAAQADAPAAQADAGGQAAPELYVVGFSRGSMPNGPKKFGTAVVEVQVTDRPVVLALSAYDPVRWELRLAPGVKLQRLIVGGYGEQIVEPPPPAGVMVERRVHKAGDRDYFYLFPANFDSDGTRAGYAEILRTLAGLPITTLQGGSQYNGQPVVVGPADTDWRRQRVMNRLEPLWREATALKRAEARGAASGTRFTAIRWKGGFPAEAELADFTPTGWIEGTSRPLQRRINRVAVDPRGPTWYGLFDRGDAVRLDPDANTATPIEIKDDIPEFSWPSGIAFDSKRNRLLVTTFGGVGYFYAYDVAADKWSLLRDMNNIDLQWLAYAAEEDCLYGLKTDHGGRGGLTICRFQPDGTLTREINVKADMGIRPGDGVLVPAQLIPVGKQLVLLVPPPMQELMEARRPRRPRPPGQPAARADEPPAPSMKSLIVDPAIGEVTFQSEITPIPAVAAAADAANGRRLQELWAALRLAAPAEGDQAVQALALGGDGAVAAVRAGLPPAPPAPDEAALRAALIRLEGDDWKQREQAAAELATNGAPAEPALRTAMAATKSQEVRQRLDSVLKQIELLRDAATPAADVDTALGDTDARLRLRAVRALSRIATPAAVRLLRDIAGGPPGSLEVVQARRALARL